MIKIITAIFPFLLAANALAQDCVIKIGSYNVCESDARARQVKKGNFTPQRYYRNSADALAAMIADLDCDIIGMVEVCDSMWVQAGSGNIDLRKKVAERRGNKDYDWILYPNTSTRKISYDSAIGYKKSLFKKLGSGIFWMTAFSDEAKTVPGAPKGTVRPAVWAKFKHKPSGQVFFFYTTHLVLGSMYNDGGNEYNAEWFMKVAQERFPDKYPSFVVGDFNTSTGKEAYRIMTGGRWTDVYDYLKEKGGVLSREDLEWGTMAQDNEASWRKGIIDHIMFYKAEPLSYYTDRRMYPTADGSLHYPSDHFPIVAEFKLQ